MLNNLFPYSEAPDKGGISVVNNKPEVPSHSGKDNYGYNVDEDTSHIQSRVLPTYVQMENDNNTNHHSINDSLSQGHREYIPTNSFHQSYDSPQLKIIHVTNGQNVTEGQIDVKPIWVSTDDVRQSAV